MELILVRHCETQKNEKDKFDVLYDTNENFSEFGYQQLKITGSYMEKLVGNANSIIISGHRKRVTDTSEHLSEILNIRHIIKENLIPIYSGNLAGMSNEEALIKYPELMHKRKLFSENKLDGYKIQFPNGDNVKDYEKNIEKIIFDVLKELSDYEKIIFVTHRSTILALLNIFNKQFGLQEKNIYKFYQTPIGCIDVINFDSDDFINGTINRKNSIYIWSKEIEINEN